MIANQNIILFSSDDWSSGLKSSKYHIAVGLSKTNRVLFVNSIGLRNPSTSPSDLRRVWQKLLGFLRGLQRVGDNLWIFTPIVVPFHGSRWARRLNRSILVWSLRVVQVVLKLRRPVLLVFSPTFHDMIGHLRERCAVYYCIDELNAYQHVDARMLDAMEQELLRKADCVVACSRALLEKKQPFNPNTYYVPHGVDWALFRKALDETTTIPDDVARLSKPIVGFYGFISEDWIDFDLLNEIAKRHPEWSLVLIGRSNVEPATVLKHANIHFLGVRPFETLPNYSRAFDVGIIPFATNALTASSNPLKLFEYLASGLPVVSVDIPEVARHRDIVKVARDRSDFVALIEKAIVENSPSDRQRRSDLVRNETWGQRLELLSDIVARHTRPVRSRPFAQFRTGSR